MHSAWASMSSLLQDFQVHLLEHQQAGILAGASAMHPRRLQRYNAALQLTFQIDLHGSQLQYASPVQNPSLWDPPAKPPHKYTC